MILIIYNSAYVKLEDSLKEVDWCINNYYYWIETVIHVTLIIT